MKCQNSILHINKSKNSKLMINCISTYTYSIFTFQMVSLFKYKKKIATNFLFIVGQAECIVTVSSWKLYLYRDFMFVTNWITVAQCRVIESWFYYFEQTPFIRVVYWVNQTYITRIRETNIKIKLKKCLPSALRGVFGH